MTFRLHSRLVFWNLLIIGLISSILGYFLNSSVREDFEKQIEAQLRDETTIAAAYFEQTDRSRSMDEIAGELGRLLNARVTLIANDGRVLGDSDVLASELPNLENHRARPEVQQALQEGNGSAIRYSATVGVEFIYVARRISPPSLGGAGGGQYILRLAMPLSAVDALLRDLRSHLAVAMLIAVGITLLFGWVVSALISRPLRQLSAASKKLAAGDLQQRLPITGDEEIAALGSSLNTMAQNLNARMQELSQGKQRLELILEAMGQGVMVLDPAGRITLTNSSIRDVLGTDRDVYGRTPLEVFRKPDLEKAVHAVLGGGAAQTLELMTGNGRIFQANVAPVADRSGVVDSAVIVFHDLSEIRRTEKMRRDFVANASHEFKTPLTSIRGYAETLLSGARDDPRIARDFLKIIERNAQHLESLVSDMLTLARLEADLPAAKEQVDVKSVIEDQVSARRAVLKEREISVDVDCPSAQIAADPGRLSTALSNLIDNAIYYNRSGGQIRISAELLNGSLHLAITDTGQGIPSEELPRIFERFYRVDKARARDSGGTGLGLAIVKHAIESQGGTITATSRLGFGSTFTIRIPG